ncbi:hypothetical protein MKEN_01304700 [Mycena kentingensis (nom. inval.)]|nr:hypothetical protein MKEN_01304700 [Mycena kentingensis (nom. inval.)]
MPPCLPLELVEEVVASLHHDRETLLQASLVNSEFCVACQPHIFHSMCLLRGDRKVPSSRVQYGNLRLPATTILSMATIIAEAPHLARHIHDFGFDLPISEDDDAALAAVLPRFEGLERVIVLGGTQRWDSISMDLDAAVTGMIMRGRLEHLHLFEVRLVSRATVLLCMRMTSKFSFTGGSLDEKSDEVELDDSAPPARLRQLIVHERPEPILSLIASLPKTAFKISELTCMPFTSREAPSVGLYSHLLPQSLTSLDIACTGAPAFLLPPLDNLTSLALRYDRGDKLYLPRTLPPTLAALPLLPRLKIVFYARVKSPAVLWNASPVTPLPGAAQFSVRNIVFGLHANVSQRMLNSGTQLPRLESSFIDAMTAALPPPTFDLEFEFMKGQEGYGFPE